MNIPMTLVTFGHAPSRSVTVGHDASFPQTVGKAQQNAPHFWRALCFNQECRKPLGEEPTCFSGHHAAQALDQGNVRYQRAAIWCQRDSVLLSRFSPVLLALGGLGGARVYGGNGRPGRQLNLVADALPGTSSRPQCSRTRFPFCKGAVRLHSSLIFLSIPQWWKSLKSGTHQPNLSKRKQCGLAVQEEAPVAKSCPTPQKRAFHAEKNAKAWLRSQRKRRWVEYERPYRCACGSWHLATQRPPRGLR